MSADEFASQRALIEQCAITNLETGVVTEAGRLIWTMVSAIPVTFADWRIILVTTDITARKQAEAALRESQQNLEALIENSDGSIWSVDTQYRLIVGNHRYHENVSAILGRRLAPGESVLPPELPQAALDEWRSYYDRAMQHGSFSIEAYTRFAAEPHIEEYRLSPITTTAGKLIGVTVFGRDITERQRVEAALRESEARYRLISEHSADVIWIMDLATFRFTYVSPSVQRLRGYTADEVLAESVAASLTRESNQIITNQLSSRVAAFVAGDESARSIITEIDQPRKDGTIVPTEVVTTLLTDAEGRVTAILGVSRDITGRRQAELALRQLNETLEQRVAVRTAELARANEDLAQASRMKDEFLATMSHELRTPLNTILGRIEMLQEQIDGPLTPRQVASLSRVEASGRHLLTLIDEILNLATIEAGKLALELATVDVALICQRSRQQVAEGITRKQITLATMLDPQVTTIRADMRWLTQILVNLLDNAVKFTPEGGSVGLEVRGDQQRQRVTFTVWDTGIGIAATDIPRLSQPFVQLDGGLNRQYEGTGLGLALVRRLTEAHHGSLSIESRPGQGSRFSVSMPWLAEEKE
jgi:PAS domain S-box-containing protein